MDRQSRTIQAALIGAIAAISIVSALLVAACGVKQPYDYPAMRLTSAPASDAESRQ